MCPTIPNKGAIQQESELSEATNLRKNFKFRGEARVTGYIDVYVCIYMFICSELIEETGRPPGLIFGMWGYFWPGSDKFESWNIFHTFDEVMT